MKKAIKFLTLISLSIAASAAISFSLINGNQKANATNDSRYDECEIAYANRDKDALYTALKTASNLNYTTGNYDKLWDWYKTVDVSNNKIVDMYSNISSFSPGGNQCGTYKVEGDCYNREHTIPQSWWGGGTSNQGCDIFIVYPTDGKINGMRSNNPLGEVGTISSASANNYSLLGTSDFPGYSGIAFEPNDDWKGDLARVYFYSRVKWYGVPMNTSGGDVCFSGSQNKNYGLTDYGVSLFMKWHEQDPVDDWELGRNGRGETVQGNRNPFIDHPEYANLLWGEEEEAPTALSLSGTQTIEVGGSTTLTVTPTPSTASKSVTWSSSNTGVATITNGVVTGVSTGTTTITATSKLATSVKATLDITVNAAKTVTSLSYTGTPAKTTYTTAETFNPTGITVTAHYSDSTEAVVTNSVVWDALKVGTTATGTYGGKTVTITGLTITEPEPVESHTIAYSDMPDSYPTTETEYTSKTGLKFKDLYCGYFGGSVMQFKKNSNAFIANSQAQSSMSTLTINSPSGNLTVYGSTTYGSETTIITGTNNVYDLTSYTFFKVKNKSGTTVTCTSIVITYKTVAPTISVSPTSMDLKVGEQGTITPTTTGTATLLWSSNDTNVATVNNGIVTAISSGTATITATYGSASATCSVTVTEDSIVLDKTELNLVAGESDKITATASGSVSWSITSNLVATVDNDGNVKAISTGTATITARCGTKTATCSVTVSSAPTTHAGTQDDPFTVQEAYQHCKDEDLRVEPYSSQTFYTVGKVESIDQAWSAYNNMTVKLANPEDSSKPLLLYRMTNNKVNPEITTSNTITVSAKGSEYVFYASTTVEINKPVFVSKSVGTANDYSLDFMKSITCDTTGQSAPTYLNVWNTLKNMYGYLSDTEKNVLVNATYTVTGIGNNTVVTPTNDTNEVIAIAMYRYDYLVNKYGNEAFIVGRVVSNNPLIKSSENTIPLVVILSFIVLTTTCGFVLIKKSKHN